MSMGLGLRAEELFATTALFTLAGMSASKSIDANILIVSGKTRQFGAANLASSATICAGILIAFLAGVLSLWMVIALNALSLVAQMILIVVPSSKLLKGTPPTVSSTEGIPALIRRAGRAWRSQIVEALAVRGDSILLMTQASVHIVGLYAVVALIPQIAYQVFQTVIQHSYGAAPLLRLRERTRLLWQVCVLLSVPLVAVAGMAALVFVPTLFGPSFVESLEWLVPACLVTIGLASLAPVLQHFAISERDAWFPWALICSGGVAALCGVAAGSAFGLLILALLFFTTGALYVYFVAGPRLFSVSWKSIAKLFRGNS
ncbi:hypothetical protein ACIPYV_00750 [Paenarthrobacter nicotinovorans]|uniref:hypothetical protein n=1 Tax=Paenarthrobacter nicotinovorans TaxID=29320 RepID=UPI0037F49178